MDNWVRVAAIADCPAGSAIETVAGDRIVALYHVEEDWWALDGVCPHQGGPLGKGALKGHVVTCPWHGWQFDVRDGQHQFSPSVCQPTFQVRVDGDDVLVNLPAE